MRSDRSGRSSSLEKGKREKKRKGNKRKQEETEKGSGRRQRSRCGVRLIKYHEELGAKIATRTAGNDTPLLKPGNV